MTFEEFVNAELDGLRRYARLLAGGPDSGHDLLADTLVRAQLRWGRIGRMDSPGGYVRSMVTSGFLSERRRWSTRYIRTTATGELPDRPAVAPSAQHSVDDRDQLNQLLVSLPRQQRAAIVLRFYLDRSDTAIAAELGCSVGAVRAYISRGLATLRGRPAGDADRPPPARRATRSTSDLMGENR